MTNTPHRSSRNPVALAGSSTSGHDLQRACAPQEPQKYPRPEGNQVLGNVRGAPNYRHVGQRVVVKSLRWALPHSGRSAWFDRFWDGSFDADAARDYSRFFARPAGSYAGEWTPGTILQPWALEQLKVAAPRARLLVLLRDPVARFRSAMALTEGRLTLRWDATAAAGGAFTRGLYADQLLRLWNVFPRDQVLVLQYERCVADTRGELDRTARFIGLDPGRMPEPGESVRLNASKLGSFQLSQRQQRILVERYAPENERLSQLLPDLDLDRWARP